MMTNLYLVKHKETENFVTVLADSEYDAIDQAYSLFYPINLEICSPRVKKPMIKYLMTSLTITKLD